MCKNSSSLSTEELIPCCTGFLLRYEPPRCRCSAIYETDAVMMVIVGRSATRWGGSRPRRCRRSTPKRRAGRRTRLPRTRTLGRGRLRRRRDYVAVVAGTAAACFCRSLLSLIHPLGCCRSSLSLVWLRVFPGWLPNIHYALISLLHPNRCCRCCCRRFGVFGWTFFFRYYGGP